MIQLENLPKAAQLLESIKRLNQYNSWDPEPSDEEPIFIMAVGWGSGSTLLQRILLTDRSLILWGEPFGRMGFIQSFTQALSIAHKGRWPKSSSFRRPSDEELAVSPVANMYPDPCSVLVGIRSMIYEWLGDPAVRRGFSRWGFKEVRLGAADAHLLQLLFPKAKFVVLVRNPINNYGSFRSMRTVYWRFDRPVSGVREYATYWNHHASGWLDDADEIDHRVIRYEDLVSGEYDFRSLEKWLGLELDESRALEVVLDKKASRNWRKKVGFYPRSVIRRIAGRTMARLDYDI